MKTLYLEAKNRENKTVRLYAGKRLQDEMRGNGDFLIMIREILLKNKVSLRDVGKVGTAGDPRRSASGRVGLSIAQALRYALGL